MLLPKTAIEDVGFAPEDALLPWPARSFSGFRLLSEYFAFPQKFMFLDIAGLAAKTLLHDFNKLEIFIYLGRSSAELERAVSADVFALGCAPIVNLFAQRCEPVNLDHTSIEYRVLPDARRAGGMEVWGVTSVTEVRQDTHDTPLAALLPSERNGCIRPTARAVPSMKCAARRRSRSAARILSSRPSMPVSTLPSEDRQRVIRRGAVPEPGPAVRTALRRRASGAQGAQAACRHRQHRLRHTADADIAAGNPCNVARGG